MASGPKVDIGRDLVAFAATQSAFKVSDTAGESYPEAVDALRVITGSAGGTIPTAPREDKFGTATAVPGIEGKRTAEGSLEAYVMPSGTITTVPDIGADLLVSGGWSEMDLSGAATTINGGGSTKVRLDVTSVSGFKVGGGVLVETSATSELYEARRIVTVDAGGPALVIEPPLTFAPADTSKVQGAIAYKPSDTRDTSESALTLWLCNNNSADRVASWMPSSYSFTMGGEDAARVSISGSGREHDRLFATGINGTLATSATSVTVDNALASSGDLLNTYWLLDDGSTANEAVKVTGISGTTWTITRGAVSGYPDPGSTWPDSTTMVPFRPTGTYAGAPVPATSGQIVFAEYGGTTATELQANATTLDCSFGVTTRDDIQGDSFKAGGYVMSQREVRATLSGWTLKSSSMLAAMQAFGSTAVAGSGSQQLSVACVSGQKVGSIFGWVAPRLRAEDVSLDRGAEEVSLDITGLCEGTSSGADEIIIIFG